MNANWYSWGYGHVPPLTFVAAWRHIVTLFRAQGADNVTWLWTINADLPTTGPIASWWPGAGYVTWVGIDGYYYIPADNFVSVFGKTIAQVRAITNKPVLLSETAVGPEPSQAAKIANLFAGMHQYGTLGLVWFDIAQNDGLYHQDWRIENSPSAEAAFRLGAVHWRCDPFLTAGRLDRQPPESVSLRWGGSRHEAVASRCVRSRVPALCCHGPPMRAEALRYGQRGLG